MLINEPKNFSDLSLFKVKKINITNIVGEIYLTPAMKKMIDDLTKKRDDLIQKYSDEDIKRMIESYIEYPDEEKEDIAEMAVIYHFPIVMIFMKKYSKYINADYIEDMFSYGLHCIVSVLDRYKKDMNVRFHTFLSSYLNGEMMKFIDNTRMIKYNYYYVKKRYGEEAMENMSVYLESYIREFDDEDNEYYDKVISTQEQVTDFEIQDETCLFVVEDAILSDNYNKTEKQLLYLLYLDNSYKNKRSITALAKNYKVSFDYIKELKKRFEEDIKARFKTFGHD
jgi:hypothetical protein